MTLDISWSTYYFILVMTIAGMIFSIKYFFRLGTFILRYVLLILWAKHYEVSVARILFRLPSLLLRFLRKQDGRYELSETVCFEFSDGDINNTLTQNVSWLNHIEKGLKKNCGELYFIVKVKDEGSEPREVRVGIRLTAIRDMNDVVHSGFLVMDFGADSDVTTMFAENMQAFMRTLQYYRRDVETVMFHNAGESLGYLTTLPYERVEVAEGTLQMFAVPDFYDRAGTVPGMPTYHGTA